MRYAQLVWYTRIVKRLKYTTDLIGMTETSSLVEKISGIYNEQEDETIERKIEALGLRN